MNVANVKISSSNVANFKLGIGIGIGNISTLATFTRVGVGERNWRFENLLQIIVVHLTQSTLSSQSSPKTQLRALGELGVRYIREFYALGQRPKISSEIYSY